MAQRYESQCVDCSFPCRYEACPNYKVRILECDRCHDEFDKLYDYGGEEICEECLLKEFEVIE